MTGEIIPAPWNLNGMGIMHFFWGPKRIDPFSGQEVSGLGGFIIARYDGSPVGPYNELLYIPGRHKVGGKSSFFISKIYVDSIDSVVSGQANWGIPKELADISIEKEGKEIAVKASIEEKRIFDASISRGRITLPITTKLIPIPLHQDWEGHYYYTQFVGSGSGSFSKLKLNSVDRERFADTRGFRSLAAMVVDPFKLTFPLAKVKSQELSTL